MMGERRMMQEALDHWFVEVMRRAVGAAGADLRLSGV
jgi:hypothetical protein